MTDPQLVIVDLDDTLIRSTDLKRSALTAIAEHLEVRQDAGTLLARFDEQDASAFEQMTTGDITVQDYRAHRFDWLVPAGPNRRDLIDECNTLFMKICNNPGTSEVMAGAADALHTLHTRRVRVAVLSNGPSDGQRSKLHSSGLGDMVDYVQISGEVGVAKPDPRAFCRVLDRFAVADASAAVMIDDSSRNDLAPARALGIRTCHFTSEFLPDGASRWGYLRSILLEG
ncbi:HAD family hydrolase [Gordonia sp. (in: high G+C Gram-positive bacteria)]|uniref:HAD family hydrolase n=1 Tax=Gordonia sp. (in: high G+C Gram-positive bacteria) TaxID=84139 RepID=UPI003F96F581